MQSQVICTVYVPLRTALPACLHQRNARAREESFANPLLSAAWRAARDAYHRHALGGCPECYPRGKRHCGIGIELRARYDHETHALEVRNAEGEA